MDDRRAPRDRPTRDAGAFAPVSVAGRGSPILPGIVLAVALAAIVSFVKPWGGGLPGPTHLVQADPTPTPIGSAVQGPDFDAAEIARMCLDTSAWLVASEEQVSGRAVRIWRAIDPVEAVRPDDPSIPWVPIASESLSALGWCGPGFGAARLADPTSVEAWSLTAAGIRSVALLRLRPTRGDSSLGGLYRPALVPAALSPTAAWPAGRYLFRIRSGDGRTVTFGVDVEVVPAARSPGVTSLPGSDAVA
jgi:hypothetical protein